MHGAMISGRPDLVARKGFIDAFQFLQTQNIRLDPLEIAQQMIEPLPDRIDVPGGDTHDGSGWDTSVN
jgi:hypothetical protein